MQRESRTIQYHHLILFLSAATFLLLLPLLQAAASTSSPSHEISSYNQQQQQHYISHTSSPNGFDCNTPNPYRCQDGSYCNTTSGLCVCQPFFNTPDCSYLDCSQTNSYGLDHDGKCSCKAGWSGIMCEQCKNVDACESKYRPMINDWYRQTGDPKYINGSFICDKSVYSFNLLQNKVLDCNVTDGSILSYIGNLYMTLYCPTLNYSDTSKNGTCQMHVWTDEGSDKVRKGYMLQIFWCSYSNCKITTIKEKGREKLQYHCSSTNCGCSYHYPCPFALEYLFDQMKGWGTLTCDPVTHECVVDQEQLGFSVFSNCTAGECIYVPNNSTPPPVPPPPPSPTPDHTQRNITIGVTSAFIGAAAILVIVHYLYSRSNVKKTYKFWLQLNGASTKFDLEINSDSILPSSSSQASTAAVKGVDFEFVNINYYLSRFTPFGNTADSFSASSTSNQRGMNGSKRSTAAYEEEEEEKLIPPSPSSSFYQSNPKPAVSNYQVLEHHRPSSIMHSYTQVLSNVTGQVRKGKMLAIMGSSGAGKTTLLDILAGRNKVGRAYGDILIDGKVIDSKSYQVMKGYVLQDPVFLDTMTVYETIMFSAQMRLPEPLSNEEKQRRVEQVMKDLNIWHVRNSMIGSPLRRGISGGEMRRVAIACELVISPKILFCDEPTTGLDSSNAYHLIDTLKRLCSKGHTIIMSIHQPSAQIFALFDDLLLLAGGRVAYHGPANEAVNHFKQLGYINPEGFSQPDFLIDLLVKKSTQSKSEIAYICDYYRDHRNAEFIHDTKVAKSRTLLDGTSVHNAMSHALSSMYLTSFYHQFLILSKRAFLNFVRNVLLMPLHLLLCIVLGVTIGLIYYKLPLDFYGTQNRLGSTFFICVLLGFGAMTSLEIFISERSVYVREIASHYYQSFAYFCSKVLFDVVPLRMIPPLVLGSIAYWMMGFRADPVCFLMYLGLLVLFNLVAGGLCICIGTLVPNVALGNLITLALNLYFMLFGGFLVNTESLPSFTSYLKYTSPFQFVLEAILSNELADQMILFNAKGFPPFFTKGEKILMQFGFSKDHLPMDFAFLAGMIFVCFTSAAILLQICVKEKR